MKPISTLPKKINPRKVFLFLVDFIKGQLKIRGFQKAIVGLSGGVDSALTLILTVKAIGPKNVTALILPYKNLSGENLADAVNLAKKLKINYKIIDISSMVDCYFKLIQEESQLRKGNKMARERMSVLYDFSHKLKALVVGTSNRSELLMGYGTLYGDLSCAFMPLAGLFKSQLYSLGQFLKVPHKILAKAPSAGLWPKQTDEAELGIRYEKLDKLLYLMVDEKKSLAKLLKAGFSPGLIKKIQEKIRANQFKGQLPAMAVLPRFVFEN